MCFEDQNVIVETFLVVFFITAHPRDPTRIFYHRMILMRGWGDLKDFFWSDILAKRVFFWVYEKHWEFF